MKQSSPGAKWATNPAKIPPDLLDRTRAMLWGIVVGDALGAPSENMDRPSILRQFNGDISDISAPPTDDTGQMIALAKTLVEDPNYNEAFAIDNYLEWYLEDGHGVGSNSRYVWEAALRELDPRVANREFLRMNPWRPPSNGALMRTVPIPARHWNNETRLAQVSSADATLTHGHPLAEFSVLIFNLITADALQGKELLWPSLERLRGLSPAAAEHPEELLETWDICSMDIGQIEQWAQTKRGFTLVPLAMCFEARRRNYSLEQGAIWAASLGGDTDTNAAVVAAHLGAGQGMAALPGRWLDTVSEYRELIDFLASEIHGLSLSNP